MSFAKKLRRLEALSRSDSVTFQTHYLANIFSMKFAPGSAQAQLIQGLLHERLDETFLRQHYPILDLSKFSKRFLQEEKKLAEQMAFREKKVVEAERTRSHEKQRKEALAEEGQRKVAAERVKFEMLEKERQAKQAIIDAERKQSYERQRLIDEARERAHQKRRMVIRQNILQGLSEDYLVTLDNLLLYDPESLCDIDQIIVHWLHEQGYKMLSDEQLIAVGNCSASVLLRARAGSGKTTVIKHKVDFQIRYLGLDPSAIMVLAFNKVAAVQIGKDLRENFGHLTFANSSTFHSLAHRIVKPGKGILYDENSGYGAKQTELVESIVNKESNPQFCKDLYQFFRAELNEMESLGTLLANEDYYAAKRSASEDTLKGDVVKSVAEKWIADFLFEHDIRYSYERSWFRDSAGKVGNYHPDFSLAVNSKVPDVVLEHWGVDEFSSRRSVPKAWSKSWSDYVESMAWKRDYWREWNDNRPDRKIIFLQTSVRDMVGGRVAFERILAARLTAAGVPCVRLAEEELIHKVVRKHKSRFAGICLQFIQRAKKQRLTPNDLVKKMATYIFASEKEKVFCLIANRIFLRYARELEENDLIDFDDLLSLAVDKVTECQGDLVVDGGSGSSLNLKSLKWLMVEEFQDFSQLFFDLTCALRDTNPSLKLFSVGDNWQAINGFAGSNLTYFDEFGRHFPDSTFLDLNNNYRSQAGLVAQGNAFMARLPGKSSIAKSVLPVADIHKVHTNSIFVERRQNIALEDNPDKRFMSYLMHKGTLTNIDINARIARLLKVSYLIMTQYPLANTQFMILNRSNYLGFQYDTLSKFKTKLKQCFDSSELASFTNFDDQVDCITAHKSKGEEADVVIVLNLLEMEFPKIHPSNELYKILGVSLDNVYAEEERLFYVAITRAKKDLFLVTEKDRESEFLERIKSKAADFDWQGRLRI